MRILDFQINIHSEEVRAMYIKFTRRLPRIIHESSINREKKRKSKRGMMEKRSSRMGNELRDSRTGIDWELRTVKHSRVVSLETKNEAVI